MKVESVESFKVSGFSIRTRNELEMNPETGKIASLWDKFFKDLVPRFNDSSTVFGVYTNYESDASGEFDVIAGSNTLSSYEETQEAEILSGKYLVFEKEGEMPNAVIELWSEVWNFFENEGCGYTRNFKTDFEKYIGSSKVEVYIGIN